MSEKLDPTRLLTDSTDIVVGEIREGWQAAEGVVPRKVVEAWIDRPFSERTADNLTYNLHVQTEINPHIQSETRQFTLRSGFQPNPLEPGRELQWDWILELTGTEQATLTAHEWNHHRTETANSGSLNTHFTRPATEADLHMYFSFLALI